MAGSRIAGAAKQQQVHSFQEQRMATEQAKPIGKPDYTPPPIDGDFYRIASVLNDKERSLLQRVRGFTGGVVSPIIHDYWWCDVFPFAIIPKIAETGIRVLRYHRYVSAIGRSFLHLYIVTE